MMLTSNDVTVLLRTNLLIITPYLLLVVLLGWLDMHLTLGDQLKASQNCVAKFGESHVVAVIRLSDVRAYFYSDKEVYF